MTNEREIRLDAGGFLSSFEDIEAIWVWSGHRVFCIHPGRKVLRGWKEIRSSWETIFRTKYLEIETEIIATEVCNNIAYVVLMENCKWSGVESPSTINGYNIFELWLKSGI